MKKDNKYKKDQIDWQINTKERKQYFRKLIVKIEKVEAFKKNK